jgi:hypothetical protein
LQALLPAEPRSRFQKLADTAERALYGGQAPPPDELKQAYELAQLLAQEPAAP